ncbi:MAG TPA: hypothetical protein DEA08_05680 [Planctomycetes bacterium]|nr:hypothetical protein [Planctomycetota bacterium]
MGIFDKLFNQEDKEITSRDLKIALRGVERERRKKQMEIRKLSNKRNETIARLKGARKDNNREEVDFLYEDLQQIKMDQAYARRESKILNLEAIGLKRYVRGLERIEKTSNRGKVRDLMQRVQMSGLDEKLRGSAVDEEAYLDALNATLEDIGMELEDTELMLEEEDPSKAALLAEIDEIIAAEEGGDVDLAVERQHELQERMDRETAGEAAEGF